MTASVPVSGRSVPHPQPLHPVVEVESSHGVVLRLGRRCTPFNCVCGLDFLSARAVVEHVREVRDAA